MKASEYAKAVREMLQSEKDVFVELLENEDWEAIEDEVYEYASQGE